MTHAHSTVSSDVTVCDPLQRAFIQQHYGCQLEDTPKTLLRHLVGQCKARGNTAFRGGQYPEAVTQYSQAIAGVEDDEALFGNRSAAYLAQQLYSEAIADAAKAVQLKEAWPKGHYRLGVAYMAIGVAQCCTGPGQRS
ncbi:hypothetical protein ABBQ38_015435 [Trebouxia sp. C0009 RCD-2024]